MGLSLCVLGAEGFAEYLEECDESGQVRRAVGDVELGAGPLEFRDGVGSYSCLHHLRAAAAEFEQGVPPRLARPDRGARNENLRAAYGGQQPTRFNALVNFSGCEGFYLPDDREVSGVQNGWPTASLGALVRELDEVKPYLDQLDKNAADVSMRVWGYLHAAATECLEKRWILRFC